jgi:hypothetical protein
LKSDIVGSCKVGNGSSASRVEKPVTDQTGFRRGIKNVAHLALDLLLRQRAVPQPELRDKPLKKAHERLIDTIPPCAEVISSMV